MRGFRHDVFEPTADHIHLPPVREYVRRFVARVWRSFVNKAVSLEFSDDTYAFEHAVFEAISGGEIKIVVSSSRFAMKELVGLRTPKAFKRFVARAVPMPLDDEYNLSARILREAMVGRHKRPTPVEAVNLKADRRLHPAQQQLLTPSMNYGVAVPIFVKGNPLGVLWGIREDRLTPAQREQAIWQMRALSDGIDSILSHELSEDADDYAARRAIEKIQGDTRVDDVCYHSQGADRPPVKSLFGHHYVTKRDFRLDTSFVVPSPDGYAISIKRYLPRDDNDCGKNILMMPGFFCSRSVMDRLARTMVLEHGYKVFSLDMRGRSRLTLPDRPGQGWDWTIDDYLAKDFPTALRWIRKHYPNERTVVLGHSMGGMIPEFYTGSFSRLQSVNGNGELPHPHALLAGIVTLASPSHIDLDIPLPGIDSLIKSAAVLTRGPTGKAFRKLFLQALPEGLKTIDLNRTFALLGALGTSRRATFNFGRSVPTIKDFVGYRDISPPEWYFLWEDVFCREAVKVVYQFLSSAVTGDRFLSFDGRIDYTRDLRKVKLPVYTFVGGVDTIAPPATVLHAYEQFPARKKRTATVDQGHLGIVMHPPTVREICTKANEWILTL